MQPTIAYSSPTSLPWQQTHTAVGWCRELYFCWLLHRLNNDLVNFQICSSRISRTAYILSRPFRPLAKRTETAQAWVGNGFLLQLMVCFQHNNYTKDIVVVFLIREQSIRHCRREARCYSFKEQRFWKNFCWIHQGAAILCLVQISSNDSCISRIHWPCLDRWSNLTPFVQEHFFSANWTFLAFSLGPSSWPELVG